MAFKDKLKDIFKPNWEAEPKNTSGASAGNSPTVQPAAATSSSDWNFDSLFTKPDGTPSSGTASGFKSLDSIFQPKDQAEIPEWKPEFDSQGFYKPTGKLSSRAYQRDIAAGNNYDAMGQNDKTFFSTYYQTLDNHTKLYTDLEDLTWGNTAENGKAFKSQYANGLKSLRDELDEVGRQYGINSNEYRALAQFKDDYFNLGRQISANYVDKDRRAASQNLDDTIDTVLSGVVQAPDYQEKVEAGRKAIESNPTVYHRYKLGLEGASDKQRDLMYYIYANEGDKGAREFFDRVMGDTINYQKAAKDFTKDITTNDTKAARFWEANKANFAAAIDGQFGTGVRQLFTNTKADPDNRTIIKGYEISDSVDDFLRQQIALDEEELAIYGDDAFARLSSEVSADWVKEAAKDASDYQKGVLGYLYLAYKNPEASEALWEEIKGLDDEIWQMVNPGTVATAASSIEGGLYRDYLGLGSHKAPSWMGNPGEGEDKEDLAVAQAIWDFALTTRAQYPQMAGNILGALAGGPLVGQVLGSAIMSTSVYGNSYKESIEQGYSPKQAAAYGVSQAMSEFGTDMLLSGIAPYAGALTGNVGRTIVRRISNPFLQAVANLGIRSMGEGLQEYVQDIIDVPIRNIIFQENNKLNLADPGAVYSFFLGAMSAAAMSAPNISSEINVNKLHVQFGRALTKLDSTQKLVDTIVNSKPAEGLTKEQRESYDKAVSIAKDLKAGRVNPNNRLVGEMFANAGEGKIDLSWLENPTTVDYNKDALTVEDMAAGARARLAELHGNVDLAQDLARYATGEQVTAEFMQALKDDPIAAQVFSELTGELDMENDKNALTIAARSTTRNDTGNKDYDTLKAENTTQTVASPAATTLFKAGIEFEEAQQIGAVIEKVANGQTITEDEAELIPVGNSAMRQILSDTLGITIAEDATIGTVLQEMNNAAATMAETRSMQQEVSNTAKQAAQARMPIPPNQQVDTTGTISIAGVEMNHDQFIENFMQKPGATLEQAEKAWANGRTVSAALNGEESTNGRRSPIPSNPERRNEPVAAGGTVQEGTERGAETGRPVDTGAGREGGESQATGEELKRQLGYDPKHRVKRFNAEQRKFLLFCRDLGFNSIVLVKGKLNNEDGAPINAKFDPRTKQLTIRWDNPFKDINSVAMHEAIHLWLTEAFGESAARYEYVNNALKDIFGEDTAAYEEMVKKYSEAYKIAYSGLDETTYLNYINEEILADMYGGMENYGAKAGQYQQQAEMYVTQTNLRGEETEAEPSERLSLDDPFRNDVDLSIPAEVRPYPGEPDAHPDLSMFSLTGMAEGGNFELQLNTAGQPYALVDKRTGKRVEHVTSEMMVDTPLGNIVNMALEGGNITAAQAAQQYQMLADAMNLIVDYKDAALVWELVGSQMFSAVKANSDKQYNKTIDFSTICKKTMAIVDAMSETMKKLGRGLTRREVEIVYEETGKKGLATPCPVCYVFSRWMGIGGLLDQMKRFQKKYAGMNEEQIKKFMAKIEKDAHDFAKKNPKSTYWDEGGHFLIGKVLSDMKAGPNGEAARAIETLNAHQQAVNMIAELEKAKQGATPAKVKEYDDLIKKLRYNVKKDPQKLAEAEAKMEAAEAKVEPLEEYQWLAKTMMISESSEINADGEAIGSWKLNPNFKPVPDDILFDLNKGGEFAHDYPLSWAFRTGKGCAAGKAIAPYSDARVGETIQGVALADVKDIRIGDANEFKNGDIKKQQQTLKSAVKRQRRQNLIGGMRYQSTSDFRYEFGSDYLMTFLEMQAIGANVQLYTKVIEAVDFLASTGADCNLSVMPLGDGYVEVGKDDNGDPIYELRYSSVTGINKDAAVKKSREYDNVQLILVGINDENIRLALEGTDVTFVIPFHGSGQSVHQVQTLMDLLGEQLDVTKAQDYTSVQTDRAIKNRETEHPELQAMWDLRMDIIKGTFLTQDQKDALKAWNEATTEEEKTAWANRLSELGKMKAGLSAEQKARLNQNKHLAKLYDLFYVDTTDPAFYNNLANDQAEQIFPYEYWDKSLDYDHADENGRIFQEYCASIGVIPRFSGINAKYEKTGFGDFTQDKGYWKLLIDRPMYKNVYDENGEWIGYGEYRAQQQINMTNIDIGDLAPHYGPFREGEMSKQYDATHNPEDLARRDNIVADSIKRIEAMRGSANVVDRNALDRTRVKKNFREKIMEAQSALREANQTEEQAAPQERLSLADNSRILSDEEFDALTQQANEAGEGWTNAMRTRQELQNSEEAKAWVDKIRTNYSPETIAEYKAWEESSGLAEAARQERAFDTQYRELTEQVKTARKTRDTAKVQKAAEEAGLSLPDYYRKLAEKEFGYTPYFYDAGYIVPNGKMLNFSGDKGKHYGVRGQDHRAIGAIFPDASGTKAMVQFMNQGNIRVMAESPGVDISTSAEPTDAQYKKIRDFIRSDVKDFFNVDFSDADGHTVANLEYDGAVRPDRVINDIKYYFQTGETRQQSTVSQFYSDRYSLALDDAGFETSNNEAPVTDERGQVLYVAPSSDAWAVARDTDGSLLNTEYIQNELGLPIYDNPHDEYVPEKRGAVIPKASDLKHKTANSSTEPSYVQAFDYLTRTGKQGARVLDASSGLGHGVEYGRSQGFDVTDLEPYSGGRPVDFRKYGGLIAAIESGQEEPFDFIISNAVINVMAQDAREELLANMLRMLKPGGELFINPAFAKEWDGYKKAISLEEYKRRMANGEDVSKINVIMAPSTKTTGGEIYTAQSKSIQKGYTDPEFMAFAKDVAKQTLGEDIKIEKGSKLPGLNKGFVITRSDEAQSDNRYSLSDEQQEKNVNYNNRQNTVGGQLKTRNGSTIKRGGTLNGVTYPIGKIIGDRLYIHKDYVDSAIQANPEFGEALEKAQKKLQDTYPGFEYNCLNYQPKTGQIQFQEAPDFDTAREPVVGKQVNVEANGDISKIKSFGQIWHHKWQWVGDKHPGFAESWNWSKQWLNALKEPSKGGSLAAWNKQLDKYGLPHDDNAASSIQKRYSVMDQEHNDWAPTFYSKMANTINEWTNGKGQPLGTRMAANQVVGWLKGKGVKSEEIKWSGIVPYLEGKKTVTREELQQVMAENEIKIETKVLSREFNGEGHYYQGLDPRDGGEHDIANVDALFDYIDELTKDLGLKPGTLVPKPDPYDASVNVINRTTGELITHIQYREPSVTDNTHWSDYILDGGENYREILFKMPSLGGYTNQAMRIHWGEKDVIAHARVQDMERNESMGKVLLVEEIQSDLHNAGTQEGFAGGDKAKSLTQLRNEFVALREQINKDQRFNEISRAISDRFYDNAEHFSQDGYPISEGAKVLNSALGANLVDRWMRGFIDYPARINQNGPAALDYLRSEILTEEEYKEIEGIRKLYQDFRRARDAYEEVGRNSFAQSTPDVPFAGSSDTYHEYVMKHMLRLAAEGGYDAVGWTTADTQADRWSEDYYEGYRIEYDQAIPKFMNKYAKQWGAKVGQSTLLNGTKAWSVDITPEMKDSVLHTGQPLFSMAEEQDTDERYSVNKKNPFPEGSAEQQMLDILTNANKAEDLQEYINKLIEKRNESIARSNYTPPPLPQNTLFPVNAKQKQAGTNQLQKMIDKYGALKKGEKPARDKNYPERTSDSRFTQRTARTAAEAASIPEYFADQIDQAVLSELLTYARITDQAALKVGDGDYNRLGYKNAIKEWNETRANTNRPSKYDIAFGERILVEAARNNDAAVAMKVLADLAAMATQSGQVVQAIRMLKDMGPVGQLYYIQKAVDRINKDNAGRIAKGTFPPITIDQAKAEAVILSNTKKEMDENMKVLIQSIADQIPVSLKDKWDAWRYFAMLGNIRTHGRNVLGNAIFAPVRFAKDLLAAAGESAFIKDPNERTKNAAAALKSQKYQDLRAFALEDFENMQQYIITGSKMNPLNEIMEARKIFNKGVVGKNFEKLRRWNDNMLNKEDTIFLRKAYVSAFSQFVAARGLTAAQLNGPKGGAVLNEARQYAALEAQKATYRDFSRLASALNHLRRNSGMGLLLDGLLPFTKTPINILRRGVEYSPVGLMKGTFDALVKVRRGDITAAQAIDEMAAGLTGTGVALLGYILASMGLARGADDDDDKKKAIEEAEGHQKYSLEIGGISYTIDWMAPVALPFFVGVEAHKQLVGDGEGTFWDFCDAMTLLCEPMMSLSMLDGINSTLSAVKSSQNNAIWAVISNILASYVSQGAPTIAGQVARTFDPDRRSTYIDKNIEGPALLQRTIQGIQGKTPWASKKMAYVDVWGRKDTNSSFILRAAENLALPGYGNRINETPVDTELLRLYDSIGDNDVLPDTVAKYFQVEGERLNLTAKQYEQYKTVTGQTAFKMIGDLIDDPIYGKMDDTEKAAVVKSLLSAATAIGKKAVAPTYKMENWVDHAVAQDNLETAAIYRTLKAANTGLSNYQLISAMDWLTPEDRGKLIMEEHSNVDRAMTDPRRKKHKFILTDEQIAREREIYNSLFWPAYNELIYSQKFMNADIAGRANMIASMQTALGKQSRTQLSDELTAAGYTSAVQDDSDVPGQVTSLYDLLNRG